MPNIPLNDIVSVALNISPISAVRAGFDLGLIVGVSTVVSAENRVKLYSTIEEMADAGFEDEDPEYEAAKLYFSQNPRPKKVAIGRWDDTGDETAVEAVTACRAKNADWYGFMVCDIDKAGIIAVAEYAEVMTPAGVFFYDTEDVDVPTKTEGNVMLALQASEYRRAFGQYSTTDYAVASALGYAMGANTKATNSSFTLAYKSEPGVIPESIDSTALNNILDANGNVYVNQGMYYNMLRQGHMASGISFDEVLGLDMLSNDIQLGVMDLLKGQLKVPQTEDGVTMLVNAINAACAESVSRGFIAPGVWNGPKILELEPGDTLPQGFVVQAESIASQSQADRDARKAPDLLVAVKLAGAIEYAVISVTVNR